MGRVVVLGAGIIGLWTSLLLSEAGLSHDTVVVAKHMPGDQSIEYTSPVAGAHFSCNVAGRSEQAFKLCQISYKMLKALHKKFENELEQAGLGRLPQKELFAEPLDPEVVRSYAGIVDNFSVISDKEWLQSRGAKFGIQYDTFNFYPPKFIKFLKTHLESKGVRFVRATVDHIADAPRAASVAKPSAVFNCTGVMVGKLNGVTDTKANYPIRGQVVTVRAPWVNENINMHCDNIPPTYIIPRVHSGGRVILGGYFDKEDWTEGTNAEQSKSILERATKLCPELLQFGLLDVLDERAGLRPGRDNGPRIERENIHGLTVIHNYGAEGTGFQCGLGMARQAVDLYLNSKASSKL